MAKVERKTLHYNLQLLEKVRQGNKAAAVAVWPWLMDVYSHGVAGVRKDASLRPYIVLAWYTHQPKMSTKTHSKNTGPPDLGKLTGKFTKQLKQAMDGSNANWKAAVEKAVGMGWLLYDRSAADGETWIRHRSKVAGADMFYAPPSSEGSFGIFGTLLFLAGAVFAAEIIERMTGRRVKGDRISSIV